MAKKKHQNLCQVTDGDVEERVDNPDSTVYLIFMEAHTMNLGLAFEIVNLFHLEKGRVQDFVVFLNLFFWETFDQNSSLTILKMIPSRRVLDSNSSKGDQFEWVLGVDFSEILSFVDLILDAWSGSDEHALDIAKSHEIEVDRVTYCGRQNWVPTAKNLLQQTCAGELHERARKLLPSLEKAQLYRTWM